MIELLSFAVTSPSVGRMFDRLTALLPSMGLLAIWVWTGPEFDEGGSVAFLKDYYLHDYLLTLWDRIIVFVTADWQAFESGNYWKVIDVLFALALLIPAVVCLSRLTYQRIHLTMARAATLGFTYAAFVCFALMPYYVPGQYFLYERFSVFCYLGIISILTWALPVLCPRLRCTMIVLMAITLYAAIWGHYFGSFRILDNDFTRFCRTAPDLKGQIVAYMIDEPEFRGRPALIHYNNYRIIWDRRPTPTKLVGYRFGMISQLRPMPDYYEWIYYELLTGLPSCVDHYRVCNYLVVQGKRPYYVINRRSDFVCLHKVGTWRLFKRVDTANRKSKVKVRKLAEPQL